MNVQNDLKRLPEGLLAELSEYLTAKTGLAFPEKRWQELHQKMINVMNDFGFDDAETFIKSLLSRSLTQGQIEVLADQLVVGETYFFRERGAFDVLERSILPDLISARRKTDRRLRFWSAGCATGEEPYSIAILLEKLIPDLQDWNVTILATDINGGFLRKAEAGIYSEWSFRDMPQSFKDRYFERVNQTFYRLLPGTRERVTFAYLNLSEDHYPSLQTGTNAMDVIFCRNVLMYFEPRQIALAAERFQHSLVEGGWLIVSPVEASQAFHARFAAVRFQDVTLYQKGAAKTVSDRKAAVRPDSGERPYPVPPLDVRPRKKERPPRSVKRPVAGKPEEPGTGPLDEAAILYQKGFYRETEDRLRDLIARNGKSQEARILFAKVLANQGRLDEALQWCREAVAADKCNPHLYYLLATILCEQQAIEEAKVSLKKALYLDRHFLLAHFTLAHLFLRSGDVAKAKKHFENIREILPRYQPDDILPESEGMTAGSMSEMVGVIHL